MTNVPMFLSSDGEIVSSGEQGVVITDTDFTNEIRKKIIDRLWELKNIEMVYSDLKVYDSIRFGFTGESPRVLIINFNNDKQNIRFGLDARLDMMSDERDFVINYIIEYFLDGLQKKILEKDDKNGLA